MSAECNSLGRNVSSHDFLFAKMANFTVDIDLLKRHFLDKITKVDPILYKDNETNYYGWAVTSRDGTLDDGVQRLSTKGQNFRGVMPTSICTGYLGKTMESLQQAGISPYRARLMQLESEGDAMPFHVDAAKETWRLHFPIITNPESLFEWRRPNGTIESVHLPADGSAWLVRVDINHRAINRSKEPSSRVHLLMGATGVKAGLLAEPTIRI
jgi:hypothetical protein